MTGTKVDALSFSVVTDNGFNGAPDGVTSEFYMDDGANRVAVIGKVTSSLFQIDRYVEGHTSVTWGTTVSIVGTLSAETMNRKIHGVAGIALGGQSQIVGYNEGKDTDIEYSRAGVTEFFENQDYRTLASEPLDHLDALGTTVRSVTFALHYAETLQREGFNRVEFIAGGTGITSFSEGHWVRGGTQYDNFLAKIKAFILDDSANFLSEIIMAIGPSDAVNNQTKAQMDGHLLTFCTHIRADILAETGVNVDRAPIIFLGMNSHFIAQGTGTQVEASLADGPNLIPFVGYVEVASYATTTTTLSTGIANHHSAETHRRIGTRELIKGRRMALKNLAEALPANIALSVGAATETDTAGSASVDLLGSPVQQSVSAASETDSAGSSTPTIAANTAPEAVFLVQKGQEQTLTGNKVTGWGNQKNAEELNNDAGLVEPNADASGNVTFLTDRILFHADGPSYINNTAITLIFDITKLSNVEGKIYGTHASASRKSDIRTQGSVKLQGTTLNYSGLAYNNRTHLAVTLDRSGNSIKVFLDGVEDAAGTLAAYQAEATGATELSLGNGMHAVVHNFAIYDAVLTGAECEAAAARDFL